MLLNLAGAGPSGRRPMIWRTAAPRNDSSYRNRNRIRPMIATVHTRAPDGAPKTSTNPNLSRINPTTIAPTGCGANGMEEQGDDTCVARGRPLQAIGLLTIRVAYDLYNLPTVIRGNFDFAHCEPLS